jgi:hypothetical protein
MWAIKNQHLYQYFGFGSGTDQDFFVGLGSERWKPNLDVGETDPNICDQIQKLRTRVGVFKQTLMFFYTWSPDINSLKVKNI